MANNLIRAISTPLRVGDVQAFPAKPGVDVFKGGITVLDAGFATYGQPGDNLVAVGRAESSVLAADGDGQTVLARSGTFKWLNDGSITRAYIGSDCYVLDAQTVSAAQSSPSGALSRAGLITDVEPDGVWVKMGF